MNLENIKLYRGGFESRGINVELESNRPMVLTSDAEFEKDLLGHADIDTLFVFKPKGVLNIFDFDDDKDFERLLQKMSKTEDEFFDGERSPLAYSLYSDEVKEVIGALGEMNYQGFRACEWFTLNIKLPVWCIFDPNDLEFVEQLTIDKPVIEATPCLEPGIVDAIKTETLTRVLAYLKKKVSLECAIEEVESKSTIGRHISIAPIIDGVVSMNHTEEISVSVEVDKYTGDVRYCVADQSLYGTGKLSAVPKIVEQLLMLDYTIRELHSDTPDKELDEIYKEIDSIRMKVRKIAKRG